MLIELYYEINFPVIYSNTTMLIHVSCKKKIPLHPSNYSFQMGISRNECDKTAIKHAKGQLCLYIRDTRNQRNAQTEITPCWSFSRVSYCQISNPSSAINIAISAC